MRSNDREGPVLEASQRVTAVARVTAAMTVGAWPINTANLDALAGVLDAASRWALVAELERAA
jgi:hypothetical protein